MPSSERAGRPAGHGEAHQRVAAVDGWFTLDGAGPALIGQRCKACKTFVFPPTASWCPNPLCADTEMEEVELSRRGSIWSFTNACYQPPAPYVAREPYEPFSIAAVELEAEQMVVLGQMVRGTRVEDLHVGDQVELVLDTLYEDTDREYLVWKWKPVGAEPAGGYGDRSGDRSGGSGPKKSSAGGNRMAERRRDG